MRLFPALTAPVVPILLTLAAALALAGCNADPNEEAMQCPLLYRLPDASRLARYDGRGTDISNLILSVRLADAKGACSGRLGAQQEGAHVHAVMIVTRGPAARSAEADIPYKIGVLHEGAIISEKSFVQHVVFPPNVTTLEVTGEEIPMVLPVGKAVTGPSYHLYLWLQLSPAELQANRRNPQ
jgi:hypothetical protein